MNKLNLSVLLAAACLPGWATVAAAGSVTLDNTTEVESYNGSSPTNGFFGSGDYWGSNIGQPTYNTPSATITYVGNVVNIVFQTGLYKGTDTTYDTPQYGNVTVDAADIFLKSGGGSNIPAPGGFNIGISLGFDAADGGLTAGLYDVTSEKTSTQIWGSRTQFDYGGAFSTAGKCAVNQASCSTAGASELAPTVITGGTADGGVGGVLVQTFSTPPVGASTTGTLDVQLTGETAAGDLALAQLFGNNFDLFWGTGDCSNAPIWGNVAALNNVPEPSSLALLATAGFGFRIMRRRKRKGPAVG